MEKVRNIKVYKPRRIVRVALNSCLLFALVFFSVSKLFSSGTHANIGTKEGPYSAVNILSGNINLFFQNPINAKEIHLAIENIIEPEDDIQVDGFDFARHAEYYISIPDHLLLNKILSALPAPFFQKRTTVPLFILYHSWKNFFH